MDDLKTLQKQLRKFNKDRDWDKYHNPKDLAISISLEATELLEHFQWKTTEESERYIKDNKEEVAAELADILKYSLYMAGLLKVDLVKAAIKKLEKDSQKYPPEKIKGNYVKYNKIK